jgi:hypothetical protein
VAGDHRVDVSRITVDDDGVIGRDLGARTSQGTASTMALVCLDGRSETAERGVMEQKAPVPHWAVRETEGTSRLHVAVRGGRCRQGRARRLGERRGRMWLCGRGRRRQGRTRQLRERQGRTWLCGGGRRRGRRGCTWQCGGGRRRKGHARR